MDVFFQQYFDLDIMRDNFSYVLEGFWLTIQLSRRRARVLAMIWGLVLALLRAAPGPGDDAGARARDRLHRRDARHPAAARDPADRRQPAGARLPPAVAARTRTSSASRRSSGTACWRSRSPTAPTTPRSTAPGLDAVPYGQMEAARSLGMSHAQAMRHVIVPQAIRKVIPPMLNDFIALMKDTSLVGVIALVEVVKAGREIQAENFNSSALTLGAIMFIVVTIPLARLVDRLIARQQLAMRRAAPQ